MMTAISQKSALVIQSVFLLLRLTNIQSSSDQIACTNRLDCSLNGDCIEERCWCDNGWRGVECEILDLEPAHNGSGLQGLLYNNNTSSWGGSVLYDKDSGTWHMWYSEMTHHCGIHRWLSNSQVVHAVSYDGPPEWRFTRQDVVFPIFAHEPIVVRDPQTGSYVMYLTLYSGGKACDDPTCHCIDGNSHSGKEKNCAWEPSGSKILPWYHSYMTYSTESPYGPWSEPQSLAHVTNTTGFDLNLAPLIHSNGSALFWTRWDIWYADDWKDVTTYRNLGQAPDFNHNSTWEGEDPSMWMDKNGHYHIVSHNGPRGQLGLEGDCGRHLFSISGLPGTWRLANKVSSMGGCAYRRDVSWYNNQSSATRASIEHNDIHRQNRSSMSEDFHSTNIIKRKKENLSTYTFYRRERPHLILDINNQPIAISTAVIDDPSGPDSGVPKQRDACYTMIQRIRQRRQNNIQDNTLSLKS